VGASENSFYLERTETAVKFVQGLEVLSKTNPGIKELTERMNMLVSRMLEK